MAVGLKQGIGACGPGSDANGALKSQAFPGPLHFALLVDGLRGGAVEALP
jgi:hypothetical protein